MSDSEEGSRDMSELSINDGNANAKRNDHNEKETAENEDIKPAKQISVKVEGAGYNSVHFKVKMSAKFAKLMQVYCNKNNIDPQYHRFYFDGVRISSEDTPEKLEMTDGDVIEVHSMQTGGHQ